MAKERKTHCICIAQNFELIIFNFRTFSDSLVQKMPIKGLKNTGKLDFRQEIYARRGPG